MQGSLQGNWDPQHGDRKTELVAIGQDLDQAAVEADLERCLLTEAEMAAGPEGWFALRDPFYTAWEEEQKLGQGQDHQQLIAEVTHLLILHKDEKVPLQVAVAVMEAAGIASSVAIRLLKAVRERGKGVVMQGKEEDVKVMAALFAENGMKATVQQGSAPHALH